MVMKETPASSAVVEGQGLCATMNLGWFDEPFLNPNVVDALFLLPPDENGEHLRQKKWHYFSFANERFLIGLAAVDATYLANAFVYVYDFETDRFKEFSHIGFSDVVTVSRNSVAGETVYAAPGFSIRIENSGRPTRSASTATTARTP